jgi:hypothetical protein
MIKYFKGKTKCIKKKCMKICQIEYSSFGKNYLFKLINQVTIKICIYYKSKPYIRHTCIFLATQITMQPVLSI